MGSRGGGGGGGKGGGIILYDGERKWMLALTAQEGKLAKSVDVELHGEAQSAAHEGGCGRHFALVFVLC